MSNTTAHEVNLGELLKTKNKHAFGELYDRYSGALFGIICKMVKDAGICEDLLQEVFVKAWKNSSGYDGSKATLFTWMLQITLDTCRKYTGATQNQKPGNQL